MDINEIAAAVATDIKEGALADLDVDYIMYLVTEHYRLGEEDYLPLLEALTSELEDTPLHAKAAELLEAVKKEMN